MSKHKASILLAEDDLNLGVLLVDYLEGEGFEVKLCKDGELALKAFQSKSFDLCLLDVMMPKIDGFTLARMFREKDPDLPVIFITARSLKEDKLKGYSLGADDYVTKPFDEEELLWKMRALIRRLPSREMEKHSLAVRLGIYEFHRGNQCLRHGGDVRRMTEKECEILDFLYRHRNRVVRREELLNALWGVNDYFLGRSLDVFITKIRRYLKDDPQLRIENVFKVGFVFHVPELPE